MITEWEKKPKVDQTYANAIILFNDKMVSIETYQENSGNSLAKNRYAIANAAVKI